MRHRTLILGRALVLATAVCAGQTVVIRFNGSSWWDYVRVLADDSMEGRETGSEGLRRAEAYTVEQLKKSGLEPAGENGFYRRCPVRTLVSASDTGIAFLYTLESFGPHQTFPDPTSYVPLTSLGPC